MENNTELRGVSEYDISEQKAALRKHVLARRNAISPDVRAQKSAKICQLVIDELRALFTCDEERGAPNSAPRDVRRAADDAQPSLRSSVQPTIGLFSALGSEVDLRDVVRFAQREGWRVAFPVMFLCEHEPGYVMQFVEATYECALQREEPFLAKPAKNIDAAQFDFDRFPQVAPQELDALLVPLVAFDAEGGRLGYGGGNYDRYVPQLRCDCKVLGIAFDEQCVPQVPQNAFDHAIGYVVHV